MLIAMALVGCGGDDSTTDSEPTDTEPTETEDTATTTETVITVGTASTGDTAVTHTADTGPQEGVFDCATITDPTSYTPRIPDASAYHGLAFDDQGWLYGFDRANLIRANAYGVREIVVPSLGGGNQMVFLPDGTTLAVAAYDAVVLVDTLSGGYTQIAGIHVYGLVLGNDGMLYGAMEYDGRIVRIDPVTGDLTELIRDGDLPGRGAPRVINFSLDESRMFIGTYSGSNGRIYELPLDADHNPTGPPTQFTDGVGDGNYHDTMGVDICGNLYVANYGNSSLYRIHPITGQIQRLHDARSNSSNYGHGLAFGRGYGGYSDMSIFLAKPYDGEHVAEMVVNVPSRYWEFGHAINIPQ